MNNIHHLEVILKTVERCNINCTYCYFFNGLDQSYLKHKPYIEEQTIRNTATFLKNGCRNLAIKSLRIDFHGGEPLMQKPANFEKMCDIFMAELSSNTQLSFAVQTNGMLINEHWIQLFGRYNVAVGVSLDGPREYNDKYRLDKRGRSTYDKSVAGIELLHKAAHLGYILEPGVLCVINPECCPRKTYHHFVHDLKFNNIDFLIPDLTRDATLAVKEFSAEAYGNFLCAVFDEWIKQDNPNVRIRILNSFMSLLAGGQSYTQGLGNHQSNFMAFTISSNGDLAPDDTLRSANPELMTLGLNVASNSLNDLVTHPIVTYLRKAESYIPSECRKCQWLKMCGGGSLINRYSENDLFTRKSTMCNALKMIYVKIEEFLLENGLPTTTVIT